MQKEKVKTGAILLLLVIFIAHSVEKKGEVDALTEENLVMKRRVTLADSLIFDTTKRGLELAKKLAIKEEKIEEYESNKHKVVVTM